MGRCKQTNLPRRGEERAWSHWVLESMEGRLGAWPYPAGTLEPPGGLGRSTAWSSLGSEERGGRLKLRSRLAPIGPSFFPFPPSPRLHRRWLSPGEWPRMDCTWGPLPDLPVSGEPGRCSQLSPPLCSPRPTIFIPSFHRAHPKGTVGGQRWRGPDLGPGWSCLSAYPALSREGVQHGSVN